MALPPPSPGLQAKLAAIRQRYQLEPVLPPLPEAKPPEPPAPPEPGFFERVGAAMALPKQYLIDLPANLAATEPVRARAERWLETGDERDAPIPAGELVKDAWVGQPEPGEDPVVQHAKGVARGLVGRVTDAATDPLNVALIATGAGLAARAPLVSKAMHVGFAGLMAKGTYDAANAAYQEYRKDGWSPAVSEKATEAAVDAGFLTAVGMGLLRGRRPPAPGEEPGGPGSAVARYEPVPGVPPPAPPLQARPFPRRRGVFEEPYIDVEGIEIHGPERGLPAPPRLLGPGEVAPPPPPPPAEVQPKPSTPHEAPTVGKMSQDAVTSAIARLDASIAEAEAKGLIAEVGELTKQRQALAESYTSRQEPSAPAPRPPYAPPAIETLAEPEAVKLLLKLQQDAADARTAGNLAKASELDAVAESMRSQLKARRQAGQAPKPPEPAPDARLAEPAPAARPVEAPVEPQPGTRLEKAPESALPLAAPEAAKLREDAARPAVQDLLEQARTGEAPLPAEAGLGIVEGRRPEVAPVPEAPLAAPAVGGVPVPEPVPAAAPPAPAPQVIEMRPAAAPPTPQVAPDWGYTLPSFVTAPHVQPPAPVAAPAPPAEERPSLEELVRIAEESAAARPVAPAPTQAEVDAAHEAELARLQAAPETLAELPEEGPIQEPLSDEDAVALANMLRTAADQQRAAGEAPAIAEEPSATEVAQVLAEGFDIGVTQAEAQKVADLIAQPSAGLTEPAPAPTIPEEAARVGPGEVESEGPVGGPLPEALPAPREEAGVGRQVRGVPAEAEGALQGDRGPAAPGGEGALPGRGAGERGGVPEAEPLGEGAAPGVAVEPVPAEPEPAPATRAETKELAQPQAPAVAPEGSLTNNLPPGEVSTPAPAVGEAHDFSVYDKTGDVLEENRPWSQKLTDNLEAVRLLKDIEATGRRPTAEDQAALARYVGWGGLPGVFDRWRGASSERESLAVAQAKLRELLSENEYEAASLSTPNAHYTSAQVVRGMWDALFRLGLTSGQRVLEPSMGIGNFFALAPVAIRKTGVELDSVTARIAKLLHPSASVHMMGLEQTTLPDNFYDIVIGNPPFGKIQVFDPAYRSDAVATESIHNYMVLKALDKARPGGIVAVVTSRYTLDAQDPAIRTRLSDRGDLVAAVRLPNTAFKKNANTEVVTDILVFRKRRPGEAKREGWLNVKPLPPELQTYADTDPDGRPVKRNEVWDSGVGTILGTEKLGRGMYRDNEYTVDGPAPTSSAIEGAILSGLRASGIDSATAEGQILRALSLEQPVSARERVPASPDQIRALKPGNFVLEGEKVFQSAGAELEEWEPPISKNPAYADTPKKAEQRMAALAKLKLKIGDFIGLRDKTKQLLAAQIDPAVDDKAFDKIQRAAEKAYDAFVKKHGFIHEQARDLDDDTDFANVLALEKEYTPAQRAGTGKARKVVAAAKAEKADILKRRVAGVKARAEKAGTIREAYTITLGERGALDWDRMAELTGKTVADAQTEARSEGLVYEDPQTRQLTSAEEYLSGNVRLKHKAAIAAAKEDPVSYQANVDALAAVLPEEKRGAQIHAPLGAGWIPSPYLTDFVRHLLGGERSWIADRLQPMYLESIAAWQIAGIEQMKSTAAATSVWGTDYYPANEAIEDILNLKTPAVYEVDADGRRFLNVEKTENAKELKAKLENEWREWLWKDEARAGEVQTIYNDQFYGTVPRHFDGSHLHLPGMNRSILKSGDLYPFQKDAIWMMLQRSNTLVALPVGAGKTFTAIAAIMEARRMGTARKPIVLAPRAVLPQWVRSFKQLYPSSQILYVDPEDMTPRSRGRVMSRIATGDYDAVIVTHEGFQKLPLSQAYVDKIISGELQTLERAFQDVLREKYPSFQETSDSDTNGYVQSLIDWQERVAAYERNPEYRKNKKAAFIPHVDDEGNAKNLTLAQWRKVSRPKPPQTDVSMLRGESPATKRLVKQLAAAKLNLKAKIAHFADPTRKDRNITFDQIGVDMIVVDEAHYFKRLFFTSKMERIPGLPTDFSDRAYDLYMKMRLTQERGGGAHFLTGTPLTNTIAEMYSLFRYLDPQSLEQQGLGHFDAWAKTYATIATGIEVDPTGANMRTATRFNRFVNLGALLRAFRSFTYYKSADDLGIERPKLMLNENKERRPRTVIVPKSELTDQYVKFLVRRAERVKKGGKDVRDDNPLLITTDGMKAALDMRLIHPDFPDHDGSKLNQAVRGIYERWKTGVAERSTQLVFLDLGTPGTGTMRIWERNETGEATNRYDVPKLNLYEDMRKKLVELGVPREEVEFIHDWSGDPDSAAELYAKVNDGTVRVLFASSDKGGVGVNVQQRLKHLHHLDVPYTPDKLEQREGRIVRQGNMHPEVEIVNWVSKGTFDIYKWQLVQGKATFISKALSGSIEADEVEDLSTTALTAEEVIALGSDNPLVRERLTTQKKLERIERLFHAWQEQRLKLGAKIGSEESRIAAADRFRDAARRDQSARTEELSFQPQVNELDWARIKDKLREGTRSVVPLTKETSANALALAEQLEQTVTKNETITDREQAGLVLHSLLTVLDALKASPKSVDHLGVGRWRGLPVLAHATVIGMGRVDIGAFVGHGAAGQADALIYRAEAAKGADPKATLASIEAVTSKHGIEQRLQKWDQIEADAKKAIAAVKEQLDAKFPQAAEEVELRKQLWAVEEKLGLHKQEQGTSAVAAQEEPGAGAGGGGEEPPDDGSPYTDSPDPDDPGGPGPVDPPDGRPDQGAQPGKPGWQDRVRRAKDRTKRRGRGGTANMGVDPQGFFDAVTIGVDALIKGARTFARWVASVLAGLGSNPGGNMLQRIWRAAREWWLTTTQTVRTRMRPIPAAKVPPSQPGPSPFRGEERRGFRPRIDPEEVRRAAEAAASEKPPAAWDKPGGAPDTDINLHRVKDEGGLRDLQAKMIENLERSLGRKARAIKSFAEMKAEALLSGLTEADFHRLVRKNGVVTDFQVIAGRQLRQESAKRVRETLDRWNELKAKADAATGAQKELLTQEALEAQREYLANVAQYAAIAADTIAAGTEVGRALAAHRVLVSSLTPEERYLKRLFRGMEPNERQIAALTEALMRDDHAKVLEISRQILKPGVVDMAAEYYVSSILSGLATPSANVAGNTFFAGLLLGLERGVAGRLEQVGFRQFVERMLTGEAKPIERVGGEGWAAGKVLFKTKFGLWRGLVESWNAIKNESAYQGARGEYRVPAIPGKLGKWIRTPLRVMGALDLGAKWSAMAAERNAQLLRSAVLEGRRQGWNAERVERRIKELSDELDRYIKIEEDRRIGVQVSADDMQYVLRNRGTVGRIYSEMNRVGLEATFQDEVMQLTRYLLQAREQYPWLKFLVPFVQTPERIFVQAFRRTPLGLAKTLYNIRKGEISGGVATDRLAAGLIGTLVSAALYMWAKDGHITGGGPADPDERRNWEKTGKKPYAVKIGDKWISLARIEPLATTLGFAADLAEAQNEKTAGDVWDKLHYSIMNNVANKTYMQGLLNAAEAFGDPERYGARMQKQIVGAFVPNLLASAARAIDPTIRQTDDISSTLIARVPLLSRTLPAKLTGTGEELKRGEDPISRFMSPFRYATEAGPEANLERLFLETGYNPTSPPKDMTVGGRKVVLTQEERKLYADFAARATAFARGLAQNRDWSGLDVQQKEDVLRRIYRFAHDGARRAIFASILKRVRAGEFKLKEAK